MMQSADLRNRDDRAAFRPLDLARERRVVVQSHMRAGLVVILEVRPQDAQQVPLVEHDRVIEALAAD